MKSCISILALTVLVGCTAAPTITADREQAALLDECVQAQADCRAELGDWADFTERVPDDAILELLKEIWLFQGELDRVFGPAG